MTISNSPSAHTVLRCEARKTFTLGIFITDPRGRAADLTGCELRILAKKDPIAADSTNLFAANAVATLPEPAAGYALFNIQAATLNVEPGEFPFAIVLTDKNGLTAVIVKGTVVIEQNTDIASIGTTYTGGSQSQSLGVQLTPQGVIEVSVGGYLPPGMNYVRDSVVETLETFNPDNLAYVPAGGRTGEVLTKTTAESYAMRWRPVGNGAFALDAGEVPAGQSPTALGDGTWTWLESTFNAVGKAQGLVPVADGADGWAWGSVPNIKPNWTAAAGNAAEILNKPTLGTAAAKAETDFISSTTLVSDMPGVHFVTSVPTSGTEGHIYFVYTE